MPRGGKANNVHLYTVYDNKTDFPVAIAATSKEAAYLMGVGVNTFYTYLSKTEKGKDCNYTFCVYDSLDEKAKYRLISPKKER